MVDRFAEDGGRLFEAGFTLGVIRALGGLQSPPVGLARYRAQRSAFDVPTVLARFARGIANVADRESAQLLGRYFLLKGHISGYTFLSEYLRWLVGRHEGRLAQERARRGLCVRYWQCSLEGPNQLDEFPQHVRDEARRAWLLDAGVDPASPSAADGGQGGFLNADLLLLVQDGHDGSHDVLSVDVSLFAPRFHAPMPDLAVGSELLRLLETDLGHILEKGAFSRLAIDTGAQLGTLFTPALARYFAAFTHSDREAAKLIQAAGYARSFIAFAKQVGLVRPDRSVTCHAVGYTDRGVSSMALGPDQLGILDACAATYREGKSMYVDRDDALDAARDDLLRVITRNTASLFAEGESFMRELLDHLPVEGSAEHTEVLRGSFQCSAAPAPAQALARLGLTAEDSGPDLRTAHARLVWQALESRRRFVFLTGNPGIGKTTAIADFLKGRQQNGGFLLFYASPRKEVNRDIFGKFAVPDASYAEGFIGLTTNRSLIDHAGRPAVEYIGCASRVPAHGRGVAFLTSDEVEHLADAATGGRRRQLVSTAEDTVRDRGTGGPGVLQSLCLGIGAALSRTAPNVLAAAVSIQSLKLTQAGGDTLAHLREIFGAALNARTGTLIPERMRELAATTKYLLFMVDEVTGDDAGYYFFRRLVEQLDELALEQYGFTVKVVVADASLNGQEVVRAHLGLTQTEPDARKIYLTVAPPEREADALSPLSLIEFDFRDPGDATLVNANSFPAEELRLRYKITAPTVEVPAEMTRKQWEELLPSWEIDEHVDELIVHDVCAFLEAEDGDTDQAIVYVQNKRRLDALTGAISRRLERTGRRFRHREDYLFIHADVPPHDRALIADAERRDRFRVLFITSSASRGLTFRRATRIFVDVPRFSVETNLMEIVQVIYRGRGDAAADRGTKEITFYLSDFIVAPEGRREAAVRERVMDLATMLALLKLCVATRIRGAVDVRGSMVSAIPIGGKSVSSAAQAFHSNMANLQKTLTREMHGEKTNDWALGRILTVLNELLKTATIEVQRTEHSYLGLHRTITDEGLDRWLVADSPMQTAYALGSLLLVPMDSGVTQTAHLMPLSGVLAKYVDDETRRAVRNVIANRRNYSQTVVDGVREFDWLVSELLESAATQRLERRGVAFNTFFAIPMASFAAKDQIAAYCRDLAGRPDDEAGPRHKDALYAYVRASYPIETALPIGWGFSEFPFLVFTSNDLLALRAKTFRTGHTLMSREMNLLTMLLSLN